MLTPGFGSMSLNKLKNLKDGRYNQEYVDPNHRSFRKNAKTICAYNRSEGRISFEMVGRNSKTCSTKSGKDSKRIQI